MPRFDHTSAPRALHAYYRFPDFKCWLIVNGETRIQQDL